MNPKRDYPRNRASTRNPQPRRRGRVPQDSSYDIAPARVEPSAGLPTGPGTGRGGKSLDGMTGRHAGGLRQCAICDAWLEVRELNRHWKMHRDGEI